MPLLLLIGAGFAGWWFLRRSGNSLLYPPLSESADAISLLDFPPYILDPGRYTYAYYMSPSGFTESQVRSALAPEIPVIDAVTLRRGRIPLPGPVPTFADVWAVQGYDNRISPPIVRFPVTVSPSSVLQDSLQESQVTLPTEVANLAPNRALAALLYIAANDPSPRRFLFIPIGASQQR